MRGFQALLILAVVVLGVAACASSPAMGPTATPIALRETATPAPLPTRIVVTPLPVDVTPAAATTLAPVPTADLVALDEALARRAVEGFLDRLVKGETDSATALFLTDGAKQGPPAQILAEWAAAGRQPARADLLELRRVDAAHMEGRALLRWTGGEDGNPGDQTATLALVYQRGLWLIDDLTLGEIQAPTPGPTRPPAAGSGSTGAKPADSRLAGTLVFQVRSGGDIYRIGADGSGLQRLTDGIDPVWSPDGTQLALSRWRDPRGLWVVGLDGSERRLFDWNQTRNPAWSPDGTRIAFSRQIGGRLEEVERCFWKWCFTLPAKPHWRLGIVTVSDGALTEPPSAEISLAPTWSPNGRRIVYHDEQGLAWLDLGAGEPVSGRFASSSAWDTSPAYSPDGSRIVFTGRVHDRWEILIMNADGSGRTQLTETYSAGGEPRHSVAPAWSPDGQYLAFLSNREGPWRVYVMGADGSDPRSMFGNQLDALGLQYDFSSERVLSWSR